MEPGPRITVHVKCDETRAVIGNNHRPKTDFTDLQIFMEEVRAIFGYNLHPNCCYRLWYSSGSGSSRLRRLIQSNEDLQNAVAGTKKKELLIYIGRVISVQDAAFLGWKTRTDTEVKVLKNEVQELKEQLAKLTSHIKDHDHNNICAVSDCKKLSMMYSPNNVPIQVAGDANQDATKAAAENDSTSSLGGSGVIKSEVEPLLD